MADHDDKKWVSIDEKILGCSILLALQEIRTEFQVGLNEAKDIHLTRYQILRATRSGDFGCSHEEYWREVYG